MATEKDLLNRLYKEFELTKDDLHQHKHYTIITRPGIEKIQYKMGIIVRYEVVRAEPDYAAVKAIGTYESEYTETFGSASPETSQNKYYLEMAEKRALSRVVLKMSKLYQFGVFGEDEADDFKNAANQQKAVRAATATPTEKVDKDTGEVVKMATAQQKAEILRLANDIMITEEEKTKIIKGVNSWTLQKASEAIETIKIKIAERREKQNA